MVGESPLDPPFPLFLGLLDVPVFADEQPDEVVSVAISIDLGLGGRGQDFGEFLGDVALEQFKGFGLLDGEMR